MYAHTKGNESTDAENNRGSDLNDGVSWISCAHMIAIVEIM